MEKLTRFIQKRLGYLLIFLMLCMIVDVLYQVFSRFVLHKPSSFTEELATFLLIWLSLLGSAYAFYEKAHLGLEILTNQIQGLYKYLLNSLVSFLVILITLSVFIIGGGRLVYITMTLNQMSPVLQWKMGYVYIVVPFSGCLIMLYSVNVILNNITFYRKSCGKGT